MTASAKGRTHLNELTPQEWMKFTKSWFILDPAVNHQQIAAHPAAFPVELPMEFIQFFTCQGQSVLDPFAGTGTTLLAAQRLGRQAQGIELEPAFVEFSEQQQEITIQTGDATTLLADRDRHPGEIYDYLFTSPPYMNALRKSRGRQQGHPPQEAHVHKPTHHLRQQPPGHREHRRLQPVHHTARADILRGSPDPETRSVLHHRYPEPQLQRQSATHRLESHHGHARHRTMGNEGRENLVPGPAPARHLRISLRIRHQQLSSLLPHIQKTKVNPTRSSDASEHAADGRSSRSPILLD